MTRSEERQQQLKFFFIKIVKSKTVRTIFNIIEEILLFFVGTCLLYKLFFEEDFNSRHTVVVVFLISIVTYVLMRSFEIILIKKERTKRQIVCVVLMGIVALEEIILFFNS